MKGKKNKKTGYHHGDLRRALMDAGLKVVSQDGVGRLNLRELARVIGVSHGAPYRHFSSRDDLILELVIEGAELFLRYLTEARDAGADTEDRFERMGHAYFRFALEHPDHYRLVFNQQFPPGFTGGDRLPHLATTMQSSFLALQDMVVEMQRGGYLHPGDLFELSCAIWANLHGIASLWIDRRFEGMKGGSPPPPADFLRNLAGFLLTGIRPTK